MIKDMIVRLLNEAAEEAEHKAWCDAEKAKSKEARSTSLRTIRQVSSQNTQLEGAKAQLEEEEKVLSRQMAEMESAVAQATVQRQTENGQSLIAIKEYQDAQS